ncbi:MAG: chemotaxis protein, partial [Rhodospirillales bacterium 20-64-7]
MFGIQLSAIFTSKASFAAIDQALAIVEFDPKGYVLRANEKFCAALGYSLPEVKGKHHSLFADPAYARSPEYTEFWAKLGRGEGDAREVSYLAKGGADVWVEACFTPIRNSRGVVQKILSTAIMIAADQRRTAGSDAKFDAITRDQAVIEFTPEGQVLCANENFLELTGYTLAEIKGQHHRIFVEPEFANSSAFAEFWASLRAGKFVASD